MRLQQAGRYESAVTAVAVHSGWLPFVQGLKLTRQLGQEDVARAADVLFRPFLWRANIHDRNFIGILDPCCKLLDMELWKRLKVMSGVFPSRHSAGEVSREAVEPGARKVMNNGSQLRIALDYQQKGPFRLQHPPGLDRQRSCGADVECSWDVSSSEREHVACVNQDVRLVRYRLLRFMAVGASTTRRQRLTTGQEQLSMHLQRKCSQLGLWPVDRRLDNKRLGAKQVPVLSPRRPSSWPDAA